MQLAFPSLEHPEMSMMEWENQIEMRWRPRSQRVLVNEA